eukprot:12930778-Prorocentrum_lima.AAC.1
MHRRGTLASALIAREKADLRGEVEQLKTSVYNLQVEQTVLRSEAMEREPWSLRNRGWAGLCKAHGGH